MDELRETAADAAVNPTPQTDEVEVPRARSITAGQTTDGRTALVVTFDSPLTGDDCAATARALNELPVGTVTQSTVGDEALFIGPAMQDRNHHVLSTLERIFRPLNRTLLLELDERVGGLHRLGALTFPASDPEGLAALLDAINDVSAVVDTQLDGDDDVIRVSVKGHLSETALVAAFNEELTGVHVSLVSTQQPAQHRHGGIPAMVLGWPFGRE